MQKDLLYTHSSSKDYDAPQLLNEWWNIAECGFKLFSSMAYILVLWDLNQTGVAMLYMAFVLQVFSQPATQS